MGINILFKKLFSDLMAFLAIKMLIIAINRGDHLAHNSLSGRISRKNSVYSWVTAAELTALEWLAKMRT